MSHVTEIQTAVLFYSENTVNSEAGVNSALLRDQIQSVLTLIKELHRELSKQKPWTNKLRPELVERVLFDKQQHELLKVR